MFKSIEFYIVLGQITIPQNSSLQFDYMILSLRKRCSDCIGAILSSSNSNVLIFCRLWDIHNHLPVKRFLHMSIFIRVFQRTQIQFCTVEVVIRNLHQQTSTVFDSKPVIRFRILDQITSLRDSFLQFDKILCDFNRKVNNSSHFFLRIHVNKQLTLSAFRLLHLLSRYLQENTLKEVKFLRRRRKVVMIDV